MLYEYEYEKAVDIGTKNINNKENQNLILIVREEIKQDLLNHFDVKDIDDNNDDILFNEKLIICTLDEYNTLNEDLVKQNKCIVI